MSQFASLARRLLAAPVRELMKNFYSKCCDCGTGFSQVSREGHLVLECPTCGLTAIPSDINQLSLELERDQPCGITRMEVEQAIPRLFPKSAIRSSALEAQDSQ